MSGSSSRSSSTIRREASRSGSKTQFGSVVPKGSLGKSPSLKSPGSSSRSSGRSSPYFGRVVRKKAASPGVSRRSPGSGVRAPGGSRSSNALRTPGVSKNLPRRESKAAISEARGAIRRFSGKGLPKSSKNPKGPIDVKEKGLGRFPSLSHLDGEAGGSGRGGGGHGGGGHGGGGHGHGGDHGRRHRHWNWYWGYGGHWNWFNIGWSWGWGWNFGFRYGYGYGCGYPYYWGWYRSRPPFYYYYPYWHYYYRPYYDDYYWTPSWGHYYYPSYVTYPEYNEYHYHYTTYTDSGYQEEHSYHPYYGELQQYYYPEEEAAMSEGSAGGNVAASEISVVDNMGSKFDFFLKLGDYHFKKNQFQEAVDAFKEAIDVEPKAAVAYFFLSESLFAVGDYQFAAFNIRKGLELDPSFLNEIIDRKDFYTNPEDFDQHLQALEKYVEANPYDDEALLVLAYNYYFTRRFVPATEILLKLGSITPKDPTLTLLLEATEKKLTEMEKKVNVEEKTDKKKEI